MKTLRILSIVLVVLHLLISIPHGMAHTNLLIQMQAWQNVYVLVVITILPLVAAILIWRHWHAGFLLLLVSMAGSFVFGLFYHFIAAGPDNVASLPTHPATDTFKVTAVLLALTEAAGVVLGLAGYRRQPH